MLGRRLVYSSKDRQDWEKAKGILDEGSISFHAWVSEEAPVGGCGSKIDIRAFGTGRPVPKEIYKIEVEKADQVRAGELLKGQVQPPRSYGAG